jgi:hypothetical protein
MGAKPKTSIPDSPSRDELKQALLRSGYLLESRAETVLRKAGYQVWANTVYPDTLTGKTRGSCPRCGGKCRRNFRFPGMLGHSMTWSARISNDGGIVSPSTLAVLRLMTRSKIVGCWIGRSAGLAPLRIFPT